MAVCKLKECPKRFKRKVHWQDYCSPEHGNIDRVRKSRKKKRKGSK